MGVIGANGAGKTTLFKILTGEVKADTGNIKVGDTVKFTYVDQSRDSLKNENSVWEELSGGQDILKSATAKSNLELIAEGLILRVKSNKSTLVVCPGGKE